VCNTFSKLAGSTNQNRTTEPNHTLTNQKNKKQKPKDIKEADAYSKETSMHKGE
jgi:hypothetical protein